MSVLHGRDRAPAGAVARTGVPGPAVGLVVAGVLGAVIAVVLVLVPAAVPAERYSYPLSGAPFVTVQVLLAVHHLLLAAGVLAVPRSGAAGPGPLGRIGGGLAAAALVLLGAMELLSIAVGGETEGSAAVGLVDSGYGVSSMLLGAGLLLLGIAVVRADRWSGWRRWTPLALGVYVFVPLTPALLAPFPVGMLVLGGWSLLYVALGAALLVERTAPARIG